MPLIYLETLIKASPQTVFDVSRSVDVHKTSMLHHNEEILGGVANGLMNLNDTVTWRARHLFKSRTLQVRITAMNPPHFFCDEMLQGDFKKMKHEHYFKQVDDGTLMIDRFYFSSPFGVLGKLVNAIFLRNYMTQLLRRRNKEIRKIAESTGVNSFNSSTLQ